MNLRQHLWRPPSAQGAHLSFRGACMFFGLLRSVIWAASRRTLGVEVFWLSFLKDAGANSILALDGPGLLETWLGRYASARVREDIQHCFFESQSHLALFVSERCSLLRKQIRSESMLTAFLRSVSFTAQF